MIPKVKTTQYIRILKQIYWLKHLSTQKNGPFAVDFFSWFACYWGSVFESVFLLLVLNAGRLSSGGLCPAWYVDGIRCPEHCLWALDSEGRSGCSVRKDMVCGPGGRTQARISHQHQCCHGI